MWGQHELFFTSTGSGLPVIGISGSHQRFRGGEFLWCLVGHNYYFPHVTVWLTGEYGLPFSLAIEYFFGIVVPWVNTHPTSLGLHIVGGPSAYG